MAFDEWVILELMGHRRLAGKLTEATLASGAFLRLDIPATDGGYATQFYSPAAVYCITPTTEAMARGVAAHSQPAPVQRWELPELKASEREKVIYYHCGLCQVEELGQDGPPPGWELSELDPIEPENPQYWMCPRCQMNEDSITQEEEPIAYNCPINCHYITRDGCSVDDRLAAGGTYEPNDSLPMCPLFLGSEPVSFGFGSEPQGSPSYKEES